MMRDPGTAQGDRCRWVQRLLDDFQNGELSVETGHQILMHLEDCPTCTEAAETLRRNRHLLAAAWHSQVAPGRLLRSVQLQSQKRAWSRRWLGLAAAILLFAALGAGAILSGGFGEEPGLVEWESVLETDATRPVVETHLNCRGTGWMPEELLPIGLPALRRAVGRYHVITAHRCQAGQTRLFHFGLAGGDAVFSLILQEKAPAETAPAVRTGGGPASTPLPRRVEGQDTSLIWVDAPRFHVYVVGSREHSEELRDLVERLLTPLEALLT